MWKLYAEDIVGGAITSLLGTAVVAIAQKYGPLSPEIFLFLALVLFAVFYVVKFTTRWISFQLFSGLREACGLFVEIYVVEKDGRRSVVIAPMVVYFDARTETLGITGHAFQRRPDSQSKFQPHAHWQSLAVYHKAHKDDFGLFYLHDGELVGEAPDEIPGTTFCRLPRHSAKRPRQGYFCDLVQVNRLLDQGRYKDSKQFHVSYFEVIRASPELEREFHHDIARPLERLSCRLKLASPREDAFARFVLKHGTDLLTSDILERGSIMTAAKQMVDAENEQRR